MIPRRPSDPRELFTAVQQGQVDLVERLLAADATLVHARDADGATALHHAAFHGQKEIAQLLIACGADVNARDGEHDATPAGWAIHYLRELGGLLAIEIEDVCHAITAHDVEWTTRLVRRHPALVHAVDRTGIPLAALARQSANEDIAALFRGSADDPLP